MRQKNTYNYNESNTQTTYRNPTYQMSTPFEPLSNIWFVAKDPSQKPLNPWIDRGSVPVSNLNSFTNPLALPPRSFDFGAVKSSYPVTALGHTCRPHDDGHCRHKIPCPLEINTTRPPTPPPLVAGAGPSIGVRATMKPAQSDYVLWVGNIPARTTPLDLCVTFGCSELVSIYLISRTGCAFVNYSSQSALDLAHMRADYGYDIHGQRLVVKAQKRAEPGTNEPAAAFGARNRYFICKSLSVESLEMARLTCRWATQAHNRDKFNEAFATSENVYFIISANRASSFYGIARMEEPAPPPVSACAPLLDMFDDNEDIEMEYVSSGNARFGEYPEGRVVRDTARGTLFWESLHHAEGCCGCHKQSWTAEFGIRFLNEPNTHVLFKQAKHLRNPFNGNKQIKIARDGTEVEPRVAAELCGLFGGSSEL